MNISLPTGLQRYVAELVDSGRYSGQSDVVQEALREHQVSRSYDVVMTPRLERLLDEGDAALENCKPLAAMRKKRR